MEKYHFAAWDEWIRFASKRWGEDIAQEAALRLLSKFPQKAPWALASKVAARLRIDHWRKAVKEQNSLAGYERHRQSAASIEATEPVEVPLPPLTPAMRRSLGKLQAGQRLGNADYVTLHRLRKRVQETLPELMGCGPR